MMCHGFVRSLILVLLCLETVRLLESSQIQMDMSSYLVKVRPLSLGKNKV